MLLKTVTIKMILRKRMGALLRKRVAPVPISSPATAADNVAMYTVLLLYA